MEYEEFMKKKENKLSNHVKTTNLVLHKTFRTATQKLCIAVRTNINMSHRGTIDVRSNCLPNSNFYYFRTGYTWRKLYFKNEVFKDKNKRIKKGKEEDKEKGFNNINHSSFSFILILVLFFHESETYYDILNMLY